MARPILPTPALEGEDAEALLNSLQDVAPPDEQRRRDEWAERYLAEVMRPKESGHKTAKKK